MSSKPPCELLDFESDIPTTRRDVEMLARVRPTHEPGLLLHLERLAPPDWPHSARDLRATSQGWAPFIL